MLLIAKGTTSNNERDFSQHSLAENKSGRQTQPPRKPNPKAFSTSQSHIFLNARKYSNGGNARQRTFEKVEVSETPIERVANPSFAKSRSRKDLCLKDPNKETLQLLVQNERCNGRRGSRPSSKNTGSFREVLLLENRGERLADASNYFSQQRHAKQMSFAGSEVTTPRTAGAWFSS